MVEKRAAPRHRVFKRGTIAFGGGGFECTVRDLSATGARIEVPGPMGLPASFILVIEADHFMRRCHAVWTQEKRVGLAFE